MDPLTAQGLACQPVPHPKDVSGMYRVVDHARSANNPVHKGCPGWAPSSAVCSLRERLPAGAVPDFTLIM
jgi:hypothetical protein